MSYLGKSKEELIKELQELRQEHNVLKETIAKNINERDLAQNKFRMLFEQSPIGMALVNHETGDFLEVNNSILKATGYTKEEFLKLSYWDITPREYEAQETKQLQELNETGKFGPNEKEYIRKDGTRYPLSISGALYTDTNGQKVVWGIIEDITERKGAELTINRQNDELRKLNADKDHFMQILAHDLRNPFNALMGISDIAMKEIQELDKEKIAEYLKIINQTAHKTYNLLDDLLIWSKSQSGLLSFHPQEYSLIDIFNDIVELNQEMANDKNITINCIVSKKIKVFADKSMLKTVLRNLISNAIKYTNTRGEINIFAENDTNQVIISVSDNGVGISKENISKLFDISYQNTTKGTKGESGTGLGLLLCKEFVEKHDGKIWVESELERGSTFKFTLPLKKL